MFFTKYGNFGQAVHQFEEVEAVLMAMDVAVPSGFKLQDSLGNFIECKGVRYCLSIRRKIHQGAYEILGVSKEDRSDISIPGPAGPMVLKKNERLQLEDALINFKAFFEAKPLPNAFVTREQMD